MLRKLAADAVMHTLRVPDEYASLFRKAVETIIDSQHGLFGPTTNQGPSVPEHERHLVFLDSREPQFAVFVTRLAAMLRPLVPQLLVSSSPFATRPSQETLKAIDEATSHFAGACTNNLTFLAPIITGYSDDPKLEDFDGSVFEPLLKLGSSLPFSHEDRFNHMHVVGGAGAGKTSLLETIFLHDIKTDASIVVVDSHGDLIGQLSRLEAIQDRLIVISPKSLPALNLFHVRDNSEQTVSSAIQTFEYLFNGVLGSELTPKQATFFRYAVRLLTTIPGATVIDLMRLLADPAPYREAISKLSPIHRDFFERDLQTKTYSETKEQIRVRLSATLENPTIAHLFSSKESTLDLFAELNAGKIILIDTDQAYLKKSASAVFGRFFISLILQAVLERPAGYRRPTFLMVDEAANYFDSNIDHLLTEARKFKLGCIFAHQYLGQASDELRASFAASTGIKFAGGVSMQDARILAQDMRTTPEFIIGQPRLHFAAHIRGMKDAVSVPVTPGLLDKEPKVSKPRLLPPPSPPLAPPPDEDTGEW